MANASWSSCEGTLQLLQQELPGDTVAAEYPHHVPLQLLQLAEATALLCYMRPAHPDSSDQLRRSLSTAVAAVSRITVAGTIRVL